MKLAISNIAWSSEHDTEVYKLMDRYGFQGLEIAPTRIFAEAPYEHLDEARLWSQTIHDLYGFSIPSMQSIWYGRQEKMFGDIKDRCFLEDYTKKAISFASNIKCHNLVFGCPKNRNIPQGKVADGAEAFFYGLGEFAQSHGTAIGLEANPPIYQTNYINDTQSALSLVRKVNSNGFKLNLDIGTMIENQEQIAGLKGNIPLINHIHISEPGLKPIKQRPLHQELACCLIDEGYDGFISIEMATQDDISTISDIMRYVRGIFK